MGVVALRGRERQHTGCAPGRLLGGAFAHPREILMQARAYRDFCVHATIDPLDAITLPILTEYVPDFAAFLRQHLHRELFAELNLAVMPLAYAQPFSATDFLTTHKLARRASADVLAFLRGIT